MYIKWPLSAAMQAIQARYDGVNPYRVRDLLGDVAFQAQLNSELLLFIAGMKASDETLVATLRLGRTQIIDYMNRED